jgi:hypothetical protein
MASSNSQSIFNIVAPIGGFGNHVRWLLLLDPQYKFTLRYGFVDQESYNNVTGVNWPCYDDYLNLNFDTCPKDIVAEMLDFTLMHFPHCAEIVPFDNTVSKIDAFTNSIYSSNRSWHNWLTTEWKYRDYLNMFLYFTHDRKYVPSQKTLILTVDPDLAYRCYLKFNSYLNKHSVCNFMIKAEQYNKLPVSANTKMLDSTILYQPTLDREFYNEMIDWFNLANLYDDANYVHGLWYQAHQRAESEFVQDITKLYKHN